MSPTNFNLFALERRGSVGWCGSRPRWDASVAIHVRFPSSTSRSGLAIEKAARTSGRSRSYPRG